MQFILPGAEKRTTVQAEKAALLRDLHARAEPLVLFNAWDVESARIIESLGFSAVATSSGGVAQSLGYADGERIERDTMLQAVRRIASAIELPVSADLEAGYAATLEELARTTALAIDAGAAGINFEDGTHDATGQRPVDEQCARIQTIRQACAKRGVELFINARVDTYLESQHVDRSRERDAIVRAKAYLDAGADCVYPIMLADESAIARFVQAVQAPVNILARPGVPPVPALASEGVKRISFGVGPFRLAMAAFRSAAQALREDNAFPWSDELQ